MRGIKILGVALFVVGFFVFIKSFVWGAGSVVINEFVPTGDEWVEVYNGTTESVDINNWMIGDSYAVNSTKKCMVLTGIILPGEWKDFVIGSGCLNDSSDDSVILKNSENIIVDKFEHYYTKNIFPKAGYSMARLIDGVDTDDDSDWAVTPFLTQGAANAFPTSTEDDEDDVEATTTAATDWASIKINEFVSDPADGNEWVEFFNSASTSADLAGGFVCDNRETGTGCKDLSGIVPASGWLMFDWDTGFLNNGGDSVILKNPSNAEVDRVDYDELAPDKGNSLARKIDGADTNNLTDWAETTAVTPGVGNVIAQPAQSSGNNSNKKEDDEEENGDGFFDATSTYFGQVIFNEVLSDPGSDEFLEIKNTASYVVDMGGWMILVGDNVYSLTDLLFINQIRIFKGVELGFSLNNSGDKIKLYDSAGYLVGELNYGKIKSGNSLARQDDGEWSETSVSTPGGNNIFLTDSQTAILWKLNTPDSVSIGDAAEFFVGESLDPRGGDLSFSWQVDNNIYFGDKLSLVFEKAGNYEIEIVATSTAGTIGKKTFVLNVGEGRVDNDFGVGLSEVCPNPADGQENEYIEIYNYGLAETDISNWRLRYEGREYAFPEGTIIESGEYLNFYRPIDKFNLSDKAGKVELLDAERKVLDVVNYEDLAEGECAIFFGNIWQNSVSSTPRETNVLTKAEKKIKKETTVKKTKSTVAKSKAVKEVKGLKEFSISEARLLEKGTAVILTGLVTALPGIFGTQYFYIFDDLAGIQVYQNKKIFPELRIGDKLMVSGEISESSGRKRVNIKSVEGFDILSVGNNAEIKELKANELEDVLFGSLIKVGGEVTELKSGSMYLDDGSGEIGVYFKPGANIDKKNFREGMRVKVTGVYENSTTGGQVWPRNEADIEILFAPTSTEAEYQMIADDQDKNWFSGYFAAVFGGLTAVVTGFLIRSRGLIVKQGTVKLAAMLKKLLGRG